MSLSIWDDTRNNTSLLIPETSRTQKINTSESYPFLTLVCSGFNTVARTGVVGATPPRCLQHSQFFPVRVLSMHHRTPAPSK